MAAVGDRLAARKGRDLTWPEQPRTGSSIRSRNTWATRSCCSRGGWASRRPATPCWKRPGGASGGRASHLYATGWSIVPGDALEAIVQRVGRPPLLVRNDMVELEPLVDFPPGTDTLIKKVEPDVRSVGRVEFLNHGMAWGGTGWVIGENGAERVVATNRHVARLVAQRSADGRGVFLRSPLSGVRYGMNLDFKEEAGSLPADARPASVTEILYLGKENSAIGVRTLQSLLAGGTPRIIGSPIPAGPDGQQEARRDGVHTAAEFAGRPGYVPGFLGEGVLAPWPGLPPAVEADLTRPADEEPDQPFELRYTHFGVRFSTSRRQPLMTAVNIDGKHSVRIKRTSDRWFTDARVPLEIQLGQADYDDPQIDRGHMVRREDPNWDPASAPGAGSVLAEQANQDTFHYTNAAPQHSTMNQGKELWQGLENYILDSARTRGFKACVFTGPVARPDDPEIKPRVQAPREFWKLVAMIDADRDVLHATAYLLSQGDLIRELLENRERTEAVEGFVLGAYRTFQIAIRDLADATGYDFSAYLAADPLGRTEPGREAAADGAPVFVPLESLTDVVT